MRKPQKGSPELTDAERYKRFVEAAKEVEASEIIEDFNRAFDKITISKRQKDDISHRK